MLDSRMGGSLIAGYPNVGTETGVTKVTEISILGYAISDMGIKIRNINTAKALL